MAVRRDLAGPPPVRMVVRAAGRRGAAVRAAGSPGGWGPQARGDLGLLSLPAAVHKTTGASAAALGLGDRGVLREGCWADVTVFDPARIADRATYDDPHQYAVGVSTVLVNGEVVLDGGDHTGALPGRVLRGPSGTPVVDRRRLL
jgi:N-acyl-D-amino-acid deacylase